MAHDNNFQIRPGRIRSTSVRHTRPFIAQALAAAQKAGGLSRSKTSGKTAHRAGIGRGRSAAIRANRLLTSRTRNAVVKGRFLRHANQRGKLIAHLTYLRREGVTRDGEKARLFGPETDHADAATFANRCEPDRHHFRFIISPDDALEMADLKGFTRDLMRQMEKDLGTGLDWVAADHWNTEHPHIHVIIRGRTDDGHDLVIDRDYIRHGLRDRARDLITMELGPRTDHEIRQTLERQIDTERWTSLDRQLALDAARTGIIDMAPSPDQQPDEFHVLKVGRLRKLETLGLAEQIGSGQWVLSQNAEATLRELGERGDIIKRIHRALTERGIERGTASYVLAGESLDDPIIGRLVERGLDDELKGSAYAIIDGVDGRTHHIKLPDLDAAGDSAPGSIVERRGFDDAKGRHRVMLAVRSDLSVEAQIPAHGATWLDRQAISRDPLTLGQSGFGAEVREALEKRAEQLLERGLAQQQGDRLIFIPNLLGKLRQRELEAVGEQLAKETGLPFNQPTRGDYVAGTYQKRLTLASGRFAMIDDGLGFQLVPWTPSLEKQLGRHISGIARNDGGIDWDHGRNRGLGI